VNQIIGGRPAAISAAMCCISLSDKGVGLVRDEGMAELRTSWDGCVPQMMPHRTDNAHSRQVGVGVRTLAPPQQTLLTYCPRHTRTRTNIVMHALQVTGPGTVELRTVPVPGIGPTDVLLRVGAAGICRSDLRIVALTEPRCARPFTLGHEIAGTVEAVGAEVSTPLAGARGVVYPCWSCGVCRECLRGNENICLAAGRAASPPSPGVDRDGGMAEYVCVPARAFVPIGELDFLQAAPLADAALAGYHAVAGVADRLVPGSTAVVVGVGGLGHVAVQILTATTAARVIAVDLAEDKLALAKANGADECLLSGADTAGQILDRTEGRGAEAVFDFVGDERTTRLAMESVAPNGACRIVGFGGGSTEVLARPTGATGLPWGASVRKTYAGTRSDLVEAIALARSGKLRVDVEPYELVDGREALDRLARGLVRGRAVLVP